MNVGSFLVGIDVLRKGRRKRIGGGTQYSTVKRMVSTAAGSETRDAAGHESADGVSENQRRAAEKNSKI